MLLGRAPGHGSSLMVPVARWHKEDALALQCCKDLPGADTLISWTSWSVTRDPVEEQRSGIGDVSNCLAFSLQNRPVGNLNEYFLEVWT